MQFFEEANQVDDWLSKQSEALKTYYSKQQLTPEEGERLIREIQVSFTLLDRFVIFTEVATSCLANVIKLLFAGNVWHVNRVRTHN